MAYYLHWGGPQPAFVDERPAEWSVVASEILIAHLGAHLCELGDVEELLARR